MFWHYSASFLMEADHDQHLPRVGRKTTGEAGNVLLSVG